jgi:hypothetical protein
MSLMSCRLRVIRLLEGEKLFVNRIGVCGMALKSWLVCCNEVWV